MLPEMSIAATSSSGTSSDGEMGHGLRFAVLEHLERRLRDVADEFTAAVGHGDGDLHGIDIDALDVTDRLGAHRLDDACAALDGGDGPDLVRGDCRAGVPLALERRPGQRAHLTAVDEKCQAADDVGRGDAARAAASAR